MKSKGFKIRSLASAINQRQGSLGVPLGLGVQIEPLKQQVQSTVNGLVNGAEGCKVKKEWGKKLKSAEQNQDCFERYVSHSVFLSYKLDFRGVEIKRNISIFWIYVEMQPDRAELSKGRNAFNMRSVFASRVSPTIRIIPLRLWRYWAQRDTEVINQIFFFYPAEKLQGSNRAEH